MAKDRKPYYDFTFSAPKSVSILWSLTDSKKLHNEITRLFAESVTETMDFAQKRFAVARDKRNKQTIHNNTDSLLYIDFLHDTSRPINGIPDMHLHTHCAVFNMTYDDTIGGCKAMEFRDFAKYRNQIEAYHHSNLAKKLMSIGIDIRNTYNSFEVSEINRDLIDLYSNRSILIEDFAKQKEIIDPTQKGSLGAKLREKKQTKLSKLEVNKLWRKRMDNSQKRLISSLTDKTLLQIADKSLSLVSKVNSDSNQG
jgi:conjugative relaxase-like TrwC/TraI family protein